jgi:glutaredoxin
VSSDAQAVDELIHKHQSRSTPTLVIGDEVVIGFDPDRVDELLMGE